MVRPRKPEHFLPLLLLVACQAPSKHAAVLDPPTAEDRATVVRDYDVHAYGLELEIVPGVYSFEGSARIRLEATAPLAQVELDAADMLIHSVECESSRWNLGPFRHDRRVLTIPLQPPLEAGEQLTLDVHYRAEGLAGLHYSWPVEGGFDHVPHVFTQGEALRSRFWFPCNDIPSDRATHTLRATVPRTWETVAAGEQVDSEVLADGLRKVDTWVMDQLMPTYLFTFAAGAFVRLEDSWGEVDLWFVGEPQDVGRLRASFGETAEILAFFSEYTGFAYPFQKYAQVAVRDFPFGGMENVTATTVTRNALREASYQEATPSWGLVAHEAAHQWFGDIVTCASWPHAWLNEGFATFGNLLYRREREGEQAFHYSMGQTLDGYLNACRGAGLRAVFKHDYRLPMELFFDGTIYPGGAARLNLLRGEIGEDAFRRGVQLYLERHAYSSVVTDDLKQAMDTVSEQDLSRFFEQWLYLPGYPELEIDWQVEGPELRIHVAQVQSTAGGVPAAFAFPLDVRWFENGRWREARLRITEDDHEFDLPLGEGFQGWVEFDPHVYVPARMTIHEDSEATRRRAQRGWSARSRALALLDLASDRSAETTELILDIARRDEVPGLRRQAVGLFLARVHGQEGRLPTLRAAYAAEKHAGVREGWWRGLADFAEDPVIHHLLEERLNSADADSAERAVALRAVAEQLGRDERLLFLLPWMDVPGENGWIRQTAVAMMLELGREEPSGESGQEILRLLLPKTWSGVETPLRVQVLRGLRPWLWAVTDSMPTSAAMRTGIVHAYRTALLSPSAPVRIAAVASIDGLEELFQSEVQELLRREPDARTRRLLE